LDWCHLYNVYHNNTYNSKNIEEELKKIFLNENDEFVSFKGVYEYVLCKEFDPFAERLLNIREFSKKDKAMAYEKQGGNCAICKKHFGIEEMECDHIIPWSKGGLTNSENCQMLCQSCNRHKSNK
ncbi:MAG: HNH endonuclease, partial [Lachnospiraceae bacterium]|nr:HNH endonuclease [Lachnospiraceae bacterium]